MKELSYFDFVMLTLIFIFFSILVSFGIMLFIPTTLFIATTLLIGWLVDFVIMMVMFGVYDTESDEFKNQLGVHERPLKTLLK